MRPPFVLGNKENYRGVCILLSFPLFRGDGGIRMFSRIVILLLVYSWSTFAQAQGTCYLWHGLDGVNYSSPSAAATGGQCAAGYCPTTVASGTTGTVVTMGAWSCVVSGTGVSQSAACTAQYSAYEQYSNGYTDSYVTSEVSQSVGVVAVACTTPCSATANETFVVAGIGGTPIHGEFAGNDGCEYHSTDGSFHYIMSTGIGTAQTAVGDGNAASAAGAESIGPEAGTGVDANACITSKTGTVCLDQRPDGHNCGTVNGDAVCLGTVPNNSCVGFASGGVACTLPAGATAATSPPEPNTGTAGTVAAATATLVNDDGTRTVYYSPTVVKASTSATATVGNPSATTGTGLSGTNATATGGGAANQTPAPVSKDCAFLGTCNVSALPTMDAVATIGGATTSAMGAMAHAPIVMSFQNISASMSAGACPSTTIELFGKAVPFDSFCTLAETIGPSLSSIMLVMYIIMGCRIIMSA